MGGTFPGPYGFKFHPWAKGPHDSQASWNVSMKSAQMGLTEVGINRAFYTLDVLKRDVLYVLPTAINATDFSKARFNTALRLSPYLKTLFTDTNNVNLKQAGATTLYIRGSRGDSNLKSIPVSELILDEVDEMDQEQIWLALERLSGQLEKNIWAISTPVLPNRGVHKLFQPSTQEHFMFKCPRCSKMTELIWPDCVEIIGESVIDPRCHESYLKCKECGGKLEHEDKPNFLKLKEPGTDGTAEWVATHDNGNKDYRGFYINQLYSYTVTPGELVVAYHRGIGDEGAMSEFHKSKLGMPYISEGGQITDEQIDVCIRPNYTRQDPRPRTFKNHFITMGVDQGDWLHIEVDDWTFNALDRDLNAHAFPKVVWQGKFSVKDDNGWDRLAEMMSEWQVMHCVIDADPNMNDARAFARRFPGYVTLCRYRRGVPQKEMQITDTDAFRTKIATVDRTSWLDIALGRFKTDPPRIALPRDVSFEYRDNLMNLVRTYTRDENGNPRAEYAETGADHFGHARCYAEIALPLAASYSEGQDIKRFL